MIVNIHNYETYFLLYVDNELTANEKAAVELFLQQNPFYQKELDLLQNAKLNLPEMEETNMVNEKIIFEDKISLYQISESDSKCLLYLDQEMLTKDAFIFEDDLKKDPSLNETLNQWKKTILSFETNDTLKDTLDDAFKNTLYRQEASVKPLWPFYHKYSIASVAAIFLLWIGYQWTDSFQKINSVNNNSITNTIAKNTTPSNTSITINSDNNSSKNSIISNPSNTNDISKSTNYSLNKISEPNTTILSHPNNTSEHTNALANTNQLETNIMTFNENVIDTRNEVVTQKVFLNENSTFTLPETAKHSDEIMIIPASFKEIDTEQEEEDRTLLIGNLEFDAAKFRGVSRKLTAIFKRNKLEKENK